MIIYRAGLAAGLAVLLAAPSLAQDRPWDRPWESVPALEKVREIVGKSRPKWAKVNYKLEITLGNKRKIVGIAKGGRLFEKIVLTAKELTEYETKLKREYDIDASRGMSQVFATAKPTDARVGIRLWHHDSTGSYIFILYSDIATVKRVRVITPAELRELDEAAARRMSSDKDAIQRRWEAYRKKQREALQARLAARKAAKDGPAEDGKDEKAGEPAGDEAAKAIFERYHPSKGWTPGRKRVIEWRRWTVGAFPTADEKAWLDNYDTWKKAYDKWLKTVSTEEGDKAKKDAPSPSKPEAPKGEPTEKN